MSWLQQHMQQFVIPGIRALARADGKILRDEHIKPSDRIVRPSSKCSYAEAGMLLAVCSSILKKSNPTREVALGLCRQVGKVGDAEFVYELDLGGRGLSNRVKDLAFGYQNVEGADVLHSFIQNSVKELKARTRKKATAIYPGRDVWCWEVMSQRQGMPSHYDSKVSRSIATNPKAIKKVIEPWRIRDWEKTVLFDTGHAGTVPRAIGRAAGLEKMNVLMLSASNNDEQLFKTHAKSRKKALACEYLAKYRRRAIVRDDAPYQELADLEEFIKAALLTIWLWYHVSPARLPAWQDTPYERDIKKKVKQRKANFTIGNSLVTPAWGQNSTSPIWVDATATGTTGSLIAANSGTWNINAVTTSSTGWDPGTTTMFGAATNLNGLFGGNAGGQLMADQIQQQKDEIAYLRKKYVQSVHSPNAPTQKMVDPATFALVDGPSRAPLEPAMDAKALGLDPVQYEIQRARKEALDKALLAAEKTKGGPLRMYEPPPPGVTLDPNGKVTADNRPLPEPKKPSNLYPVDKLAGYAGGRLDPSTIVPVLINSPTQPTQASGGPSGGAAPSPTIPGKLKVVPIVGALPKITDGSGKAITG